MNSQINARLLFLSLVCLLWLGCQDAKNRPAKGFLDITYRLSKAEGLQPSFQTVIWLADVDGNYVKSVLVSEYLSYGGFNDTTICPTWSRSASWENTPEEEFDAVTQATPPVGDNALRVDCRQAGLLPGAYQYFVQVHILERYNILYSGRINIGGEDVDNIAKATYIPARHPQAGDVVSNVRAHYHKE